MALGSAFDLLASLRRMDRLTILGENRQDSCEIDAELEGILGRTGEEVTEGEAGGAGVSNAFIAFASVELLRKLNLEDGRVAEAGVVGVLNATFDIVGEDKETKEDVAVTEETIDSPTKLFSAATTAGYSKLDVRPMARGFQDSTSNWGVIEGEPRAEDDAEALDSDEVERIGG